MAVRSRRLNANVSWGNTTGTVIYTVPAGRTAIVRAMVITNVSSTATGVGQLRLNGTSSGFNLTGEKAIAPLDDFWIPDEFVLNPGDVLYGRGTYASAALRSYLFGSLLLGEPE